MKEELNKIIDTLPSEVQQAKFFVEFAEELFKGRKVRFTYSELEKGRMSLKIILNDNLTLFFFEKAGEWYYDGWEMGDYKDYWKKGKLSPIL